MDFPAIVEAAVVEPLGLRGALRGPLHDLLFAVKDNYNVRGLAQRCGSPRLAELSRPERRHAALVGAALREGATLFGRAVMDEFAYGIEGINIHDGTPIAPDDASRVCGGSSSGCASLVAAGVVDFALASDTAGSIRVPAAWCGIFGYRPPIGELDGRGVLPLAPTFDVPGMMARNVSILELVLESICPLRQTSLTPAIVTSLVELVQEGVAIEPSIGRMFALVMAAIAGNKRDAQRIILEAGETAEFVSVLRTIQSIEARAQWWPFVAPNRATLAPWILQRFVDAGAVSANEALSARSRRSQLLLQWRERLGAEKILIFPTLPCSAPRKDASVEERARVRQESMRSVAFGSVLGAAQLHIPAPPIDGAHWGISLLTFCRDRRVLWQRAAEVVEALSRTSA
jgi:amidase